MKINIIIPFTYLTGGIRVIFLYANYLSKKGYDVCVYVPMVAYKFNHNNIKRLKMSLINTIKRRSKVEWFNCNFTIKLIPKINNLFLRNADRVIATAWPTAVDVSKLDKSKGEKVYLIQDYEIWSGDPNEVDSTFNLPLNRIVITKTLQDLIKEKFNADSTIIYNGLDENEFLLGEKVTNSTKNILMLYNEAENKGSIEGIEILKQIKEKYNVNIKLFGFKYGFNIPNQFEFYENPSREKLLSLYRESDIYVFPSKHEAWGLPVMEAMANKCAVVGNNVGCLKEIATDNLNSLLIENCNYKDMKFKIEGLLNDNEKLKKIQDNGYELAKKFKWINSFEKFESFLSNLN
ncbi:glycosyltransferase family 4 protein [Clostridium sp. NSJ-6]|uniref:Glycosyltransferase family 4 protein n=1 Tax=Clostridium hominis TaxID=2763036 RepID=A0ABR7D9J0_9CLOT|nr:glycosyltransferase family 4 protein [Clostridium hominis]MBC5628067.1 glycosyltransferase family 4 protein [Clostridium hominis]